MFFLFVFFLKKRCGVCTVMTFKLTCKHIVFSCEYPKDAGSSSSGQSWHISISPIYSGHVKQHDLLTLSWRWACVLPQSLWIFSSWNQWLWINTSIYNTVEMWIRSKSDWTWCLVLISKSEHANTLSWWRTSLTWFTCSIIACKLCQCAHSISNVASQPCLCKI